jgi:carboxypeptidase D
LNWSVNGTNTGTWVESRNLTYVKIFNASHMAPFDVPHLTHDMMLRFMNVDFSAIVSGSALIPSSLGTKSKPHFLNAADSNKAMPAVPSGKTTEQSKAMWEAYYNAGSAALVLVLILLVIGLFVWYRMRRRSGLQLPASLAETREVEESIPLNSSMRDEEEGGGAPLGSGRLRSGKGKGKAVAEPVFDVGSDDDEPYSSKRVH